MTDIIDKIIEEFYELEKKDFGFNVGSADQTKSTIIDASDSWTEFGETDNKDDFKRDIMKTMQKDGFYIEQCYQIYLAYSSNEKHKKQLEIFKPIEEQSIQAYCDAYNDESKYWRLNVDIEPITDNGGWQFLEFWHYRLTDEAKKLIQDYLNQEDDKMENLKYKNNEEATEDFIRNNWHIYHHFGEDDFLQYLQLQMLKKKDYYDINDKEHQAYKNIDIKKMIQYAHKIIQDNKFYEIANNEYEIKQRSGLIDEATAYLGRLDNEELRDIIFHHPMRDIQDDEYDDDLINAENLCSLKYRYDFVQEAIDEEDKTIKNYLEKLDEQWDDCDCIYKALELVLCTQEQKEWDNIYYYIRNIIEKFDKNENNEYKFAKEDIIQRIKRKYKQ